MRHFIYSVLLMILAYTGTVTPTFDYDKEGYRFGKKIVNSLESFWNKQSVEAKQKAYKAAQEHIGKIVTPEYVQKDIVNPVLPATVEYAAQEAQKYIPGLVEHAGQEVKKQIPELIDTAAAHMWKEAGPYVQKAKSYAIGSALALGAAGTGYWLYNRWTHSGFPRIIKALEALDRSTIALIQDLTKQYAELKDRKLLEKEKTYINKIVEGINTHISTFSESFKSLEDKFRKLLHPNQQTMDQRKTITKDES